MGCGTWRAFDASGVAWKKPMEMRGVGGDESLLPRRSMHIVHFAQARRMMEGTMAYTPKLNSRTLTTRVPRKFSGFCRSCSNIRNKVVIPMSGLGLWLML